MRKSVTNDYVVYVDLAILCTGFSKILNLKFGDSLVSHS